MAFSAKRNNYTAVLERVYGISEGRIIHIHGSLRDHECDPVLGHGNIERIEQIDERLEEAGRMYDEKEISICKVIRDYYESTYKDVNRYVYKLSRVSNICYWAFGCRSRFAIFQIYRELHTSSI